MCHNGTNKLHDFMIDWRLPEHRIEAFTRWLHWRLLFGDLDHFEYGQRLAQHLPREEKLWYAVYFGMTYQAGMARVLYDNVGNGLQANLQHVQQFSDATYSKHIYGKDARYNKGRLPEMLASIQNSLLQFNSLSNWLEHHHILNGFEGVQSEILKWHKFGPMCTWLAMQFMHEVAEFETYPTSLPKNYSVFTCYAYLLNDLPTYQYCLANKRPHPSQYNTIDSFSLNLLAELKAYLPPQLSKKLNMYNLESHLCQFRKLVLGRDFPGHSQQDQYHMFEKLANHWPEIDWAVLDPVFDGMHHRLIRRQHENKALRLLFKETGQFWFLHEIFEDLPNMQKVLGLADKDFKSHSVIQQRIQEYTYL